jgi:hypothetical protein
VKAYAFAFKDTVAYVAAETGLYRTGDGGKTWQQSGTINVQGSDTRIETSAFFSAGVIGDTVYGGTADGLAKTIDNASHAFGASWQAVRAYQPLASTGSAYAYPNPFSPRIDVARIHYKTSGASASVTIEIFDFGMNRVKTVLKDAQRTGAGDHDEPWSGQNDRGKIVPNGVYFYRVILDGGDPIWGKIMVIQ